MEPFVKGDVHVIRHAARTPSPNYTTWRGPQKSKTFRKWSQMIARLVPHQPNKGQGNVRTIIQHLVKNGLRSTPELPQVAPEAPTDHQETSKTCG